jgi:hypothetical protein
MGDIDCSIFEHENAKQMEVKHNNELLSIMAETGNTDRQY